jgi:hypothetical protein
LFVYVPQKFAPAFLISPHFVQYLPPVEDAAAGLATALTAAWVGAGLDGLAASTRTGAVWNESVVEPPWKPWHTDRRQPESK